MAQNGANISQIAGLPLDKRAKSCYSAFQKIRDAGVGETISYRYHPSAIAIAVHKVTLQCFPL